MLTNIFESRNKTFLNLVKLGDYLGRSLRENVELFTVNDDLVTYLTESGYAVQGRYTNKGLNISEIKIEDATVFENKKAYSKLVDKKVNSFLADLLENDLSKANNSFDSILGLWETRLQFERTKDRLITKSERFDESLKITSSPEFERLKEVKDDLVNLLKESSNFINIPEIRNTIKLSSVISKSFNLPKISYDELNEMQEFAIPSIVNNTLYEHLCKQELIAKEFIESKSDLDKVWISNEKIQKLPSFIYESNENVMQLVAEIITELPYFAMATKKQITSLVENNLDLLIDTQAVPSKDIKNFVGKIFEFKKPVKDYIVQVLNEKYGINIQNLTETPTFDSLVKTQVLIFESLAILSPKNSILRKVLSEFSQSLKGKGGIESVDVSDFLNEVFEACDYTSILNETSLMNYMNFDKVADDLGKIGQVLKMIQSGMGGGMGGGMGDMLKMAGAPAPAAGGVQPPMGGDKASAMAQEVPEGEGEYESDGGDLAGMEEPGMEGESGDQMPAMDAEDAAGEVADEEAAAEGGDESQLGDEYGEDVELTDKDELIDNMRELEALISDLKSDLGLEGGMEGEEGEMPPEEGMEGEEGEMPPEEDMEGETAPVSDFVGGGEEEDEGEGEGEGEEESEEEEEEAPPTKKKSKKSKSDK